MEFSTYVALGDSLTAGNGCEPEERWADLLAADLAADHPGLNYFNLGQDGATSEAILDQVPEAISLRPDLVTLIAGANDVILSLRPDISVFSVRFGLMLDRLKRALAGLTLVTATYPQGWQMPGIGTRTQARINNGMRELNEEIRTAAASRDVPCVDVVDHPGIEDPVNYGPDGLHPSLAGHRQAAIEFSKAIERSIDNERVV